MKKRQTFSPNIPLAPKHNRFYHNRFSYNLLQLVFSKSVIAQNPPNQFLVPLMSELVKKVSRNQFLLPHTWYFFFYLVLLLLLPHSFHILFTRIRNLLPSFSHSALTLSSLSTLNLQQIIFLLQSN